MSGIKKLTILHSNDMHGDFFPKLKNGVLTGGVSMLSGYIGKMREKHKNLLYTISGDMFRGSTIDSEYKGISTIDIINELSPDMVTIGNHEVDYGIAHLLFIEKCASFPIINANMYLKTNGRRLFTPYKIIETGGVKTLFIGIMTESVLAQTKQEKLIGEYIDVKDAAVEIEKICDEVRDENIDFTVLLTHIGIEEDKVLAEELSKRCGVDVIIGGHSHTKPEKPIVSAGIPIVQAGSGTGQIGKFEIEVDTDKNFVKSYSWELVDIDENTSPRNMQMEKTVLRYKRETDKRYSGVIARLERVCTHPARNTETELGKLIADALCEELRLDIMLVGSGSIRGQELGPVVKYMDLLQIFPFNDEIYRIFVTGTQIKRMMRYMLREEAFTAHTEFYQFSKGFCVKYSRAERKLISVSLNGAEIEDETEYRVGIQAFHLINIKEFLDVSEEEISTEKRPKVVAVNCTDILEEYFGSFDTVKIPDEKRLIIL